MVMFLLPLWKKAPLTFVVFLVNLEEEQEEERTEEKIINEGT